VTTSTKDQTNPAKKKNMKGGDAGERYVHGGRENRTQGNLADFGHPKLKKLKEKKKGGRSRYKHKKTNAGEKKREVRPFHEKTNHRRPWEYTQHRRREILRID